MRLVEGRDQPADVDGNDGDNDAGQEDGCQLVHVLHAHKDQQWHQEETDAAVHPHVVQHGRPAMCKNGSFRDDVQLEEKKKKKKTTTITANLKQNV